MRRRVCAYCGDRTGKGDALELTLRGSRGEVIALRWHLDRCADVDEHHQAIADAVALPDGVAGDRAAMDAYRAIRDRAAARGDVRDVVDIVRDFPTGRWTLRGAGAWGLVSERRGRGVGK